MFPLKAYFAAGGRKVSVRTLMAALIVSGHGLEGDIFLFSILFLFPRLLCDTTPICMT